MSELEKAKQSIRDLAVKAKSVVEDQKMTPAEKRADLDKIEVDLKAFADTVSLHEQAARLMGGGEAAEETKSGAQDGTRTKSLGEMVTDSEAYRNAVVASKSQSRFSYSTEIKAAVTIDEGTTFADGFPTGAAGAAVIPDFLPGIVDLRFRKLLIADLFAQGATTSNQISYVKETTFNNAAAGTAEKGKKPQSDDAIARVVEQVGKIAHFMKMTDEMLQDAQAYRSFLENRLVFGVKLKEDGDLLSATGYPSVNGLLNRTGFQTAIALTTGTLADPTTVIDAVYEQITAVRFNAFVEPDAVVVNPSDWQHIRLAKDANKQYYGGGPFTGAYGNGGYSNVDALWGLRVLQTAAMPVGTMLVGGYRECAQVFRRQGITLEMTNSNVDDFENNLVTARAEERLALAVYRPGGFGKVNVTWA